MFYSSFSVAAPAQVRFAHTDIQVPDFSAYRRDGTKDNHASSASSASSRRAFTYLFVGGMPYLFVRHMINEIAKGTDIAAHIKVELFW